TPHPDTLAEADVTVPPAPTPVAPPGPPLPWGGEGTGSAAVVPAGPSSLQPLEPLGGKSPGLQRVPAEGPDLLLTKATSSAPDPKRGRPGASDRLPLAPSSWPPPLSAGTASTTATGGTTILPLPDSGKDGTKAATSVTPLPAPSLASPSPSDKAFPGPVTPPTTTS